MDLVQGEVEVSGHDLVHRIELLQPARRLGIEPFGLTQVFLFLGEFDDDLAHGFSPELRQNSFLQPEKALLVGREDFDLGPRFLALRK